jgi:hypothetical protein
MLSLWSDKSEFLALFFMDFNVWIGPHFMFKSCTCFLIFQ